MTISDNPFKDSNDVLIASKDLDVSLPCDKCDGDCCGPVPFELKKLSDIFEKYQNKKDFKKRFPYNENTIGKHMVFHQAFPDNSEVVIPMFRKIGYYKKIGIGKDSCIFKKDDINGGCMIYEDRPTICQCYGKKELVQCPYAGLPEQPKDLEVRKELVKEGFKSRNNQMKKLATETINKLTFKGEK